MRALKTLEKQTNNIIKMQERLAAKVAISHADMETLNELEQVIKSRKKELINK
ncbi:hypothetical protein H5S40_06055 [Limosilactobacillus sp. RRLNB_1_1]|uniref:Uncharacterized protein n=1 Tax=Limosilactobacillus albertensis TaxID=2759752 RepID=A0A7W3TRS5_9LACO|nr:hypothetical protein [Limosilactobacillus albertensis]MBB1069712.1 hypothetical protein [Limosilactobacillus albertensis]MCD7117826.1 hypothetical protein [Limosilactobacillus albertensis]MCD7128464.1 hypothetical protein [Limosilactobacillus albertensis]